MPFTSVTARGSIKVSGIDSTSVLIAVTANIVVGKILIACIVIDNTATADGASSTVTIADDAVNTWVKIGEYTDSDGAASDGATIAMFASKITTQINSAANITFTFSNALDKYGYCFEVTVGDGHTFGIGQVGTNSSASGTAASIDVSVAGLPSQEYLLVGLAGAEGEDNVKGNDADYTELLDDITSTVGALAVNLSIHVQTRVATLTADTCTSSAWTYTNLIAMLAALYETDVVPYQMLEMFESTRT
jgi:hypothetical protein